MLRFPRLQAMKYGALNTVGDAGQPSALIADAWKFDLHDIGAPVTEHRCRLGTLHEQPCLQHLDSVECTHGRRPYWPTGTRLGSDVTDSVRAISDVCGKIPEDRVSEILSQTWIFRAGRTGGAVTVIISFPERLAGLAAEQPDAPAVTCGGVDDHPWRARSAWQPARSRAAVVRDRARRLRHDRRAELGRLVRRLPGVLEDRGDPAAGVGEAARAASSRRSSSSPARRS